MEKLSRILLIGLVFSIIPMIYIILASKIGIDNFFKLVFVLQVGLGLCLVQGTLIEKYKK